jgi:hypothetical protein
MFVSLMTTPSLFGYFLSLLSLMFTIFFLNFKLLLNIILIEKLNPSSPTGVENTEA